MSAALPVLAVSRAPELHKDPRRPGRAMMAVWCACGRFFTLTPEAISNARPACPACGVLP